MWFSERNVEQDPVFIVIQEMEKFRLRIHSDVYDLHEYSYKIMELNEQIENNQVLVKSGFPSVYNETETDEVLAAIEGGEEVCSQLASRLVEYRRLGLGEYVDAEMRAMELELEIRQSWIESDYDFDLTDAHWELVIDFLAESLSMLVDRDKIFPLWRSLEYKRMTGPKAKELIDTEIPLIDNTPREYYILGPVLQFLINLKSTNFKRMSYVCDKYSFYCKYLDDEVGNMAELVVEMPQHPETQAWRDILTFYTADDAELCKTFHTLVHQGKLQFPDALLITVSFRIYRSCLNRGLVELADEWSRSLSASTSQEQLSDLLGRTRLGLQQQYPRESHQKHEGRIALNGSHIGVNSNYRLPVPKENYTSTSSAKPWWEERLKAQPALDFDQDKNGKLVLPATSQQSWNSQATTEGPPEASTRDSFWNKSPEEQSELLQLQNLEANRAAAAFYRDHRRVSSADMSRELPLCPIDSEQTECLIRIKWKNSDGQDKERRTNLHTGKPYHCRIFSFDAANDEWIGNDTFYTLNGQLDVKQEGGSRVPIVGDDPYGGSIYIHPPLFKMYRDAGDHRLDKYLADVRAQSVAAYYVDRFRKRTCDKFGCLTMLTVQLLMVYDTFERKMIIDFATREIFRSAGDFDKFTNNWSWKNRDVKVDIFEAFSHFTYDDSAGVIMVSDLQGFAALKEGTGGIQYALTDPVIHSQARDTQTFGHTNYGTEGMNEFFASVHKECNHICEFLRLKRPDDGSRVDTQQH